MIVVDMAIVIRTTLLGEVVRIDGNENIYTNIYIYFKFVIEMDNVNGGRSISRE